MAEKKTDAVKKSNKIGIVSYGHILSHVDFHDPPKIENLPGTDIRKSEIYTERNTKMGESKEAETEHSIWNTPYFDVVLVEKPYGSGLEIADILAMQGRFKEGEQLIPVHLDGLDSTNPVYGFATTEADRKLSDIMPLDVKPYMTDGWEDLEDYISAIQNNTNLRMSDRIYNFRGFKIWL